MRLQKHQAFALTLLGVLVFSGCGNYYEEYGVSGNQKFSTQETLGFPVIKVIFERNRCLNCHARAHGSVGRVNLETYGNAFSVAERVKSTLVSDSMPPSGPSVSDEDKAIVYAWVEAGAPETSDLPLPTPGVKPTPPSPAPPEAPPAPPEQPAPPPPGPGPIEPVAIDFAMVKARIFEPYCIECHGRYEKYEKVLSRLKDIQDAVETNRMPKESPPLAPELKQLLADWIRAGAPEKITSNLILFNGSFAL